MPWKFLTRVSSQVQAEDRAKSAAAAHDEHSAELEQEASAALDRAAEAQQVRKSRL